MTKISAKRKGELLPVPELRQGKQAIQTSPEDVSVQFLSGAVLGTDGSLREARKRIGQDQAPISSHFCVGAAVFMRICKPLSVSLTAIKQNWDHEPQRHKMLEEDTYKQVIASAITELLDRCDPWHLADLISADRGHELRQLGHECHPEMLGSMVIGLLNARGPLLPISKEVCDLVRRRIGCEGYACQLADWDKWRSGSFHFPSWCDAVEKGAPKTGRDYWYPRCVRGSYGVVRKQVTIAPRPRRVFYAKNSHESWVKQALVLQHVAEEEWV